MRYKNLVLLLILIFSEIALYSQKTGKWDQFIDYSKIENNKTIPNTPIYYSDYYLVILNKDIKAQDLSALGFSYTRKLDNNVFIINNTIFNICLNNRWLIKELYPANNQWKLSPALLKNSHESKTNADKMFCIKMNDCIFNEINKRLNNQQVHITVIKEYKNMNIAIIRCSSDSVFNSLILLDQVIFMDEIKNPVSESIVLDNNLQVNRINLINNHFPELNGADVVVSIKEPLYDTLDIDLLGRHIPSHLSTNYTSIHTTNMATIIAGGGSSSYMSLGVVWKANITSSDYSLTMPDNEEDYYSLDVSVQNHSYGTVIENYYGAQAAAFDLSVNDNPCLMHLFSVGNNGTGSDTTGTYSGVERYANLTGNFKMAKNILTIGSVDAELELNEYISRGPAYDGRVKPELTAYSISGSSVSAALVSGIVGLLQQEYKKEHHDSLPESALLKSIFINSANDVGSKNIDYLSGYGNIDAFGALMTMKEQRFFIGSLNTNETRTFDIHVPANSGELKITLAWNDPAASVNANKALINDLDLEVMDNTTKDTWLPWVLNHYPHIDSLQQLPTRKSDRINNIEQVTIDNPSEGTYTLKISAYDIPYGPQQFYIAYEWSTNDTFSWTSPTNTDIVPFGKSVDTSAYLRWESSLDATNGKLEYSTDNGINWRLIDTSVPLSKGFYKWQIPVSYTHCIARMTVENQSFLTDTFTLSWPVNLYVGFNCDDSLMIRWPVIKNADKYALYNLGDKYLEPITETTDTFAIYKKNQLKSYYLAVAPFIGTKKGVNSMAFDYTIQGTECYLINFIADIGEGFILLNLNLGTSYEVQSIIFEKKGKHGYYTISTIESMDGSSFNYTDNEPAQGLNTYRTKLKFNNGKELEIPPIDVYFLTDQPCLVFPNPLNRNSSLNIYTKSFSNDELVTFKLHSIYGQQVFETELISDRENITLPNLRAGVYVYEISMFNTSETGKLIIY